MSNQKFRIILHNYDDDDYSDYTLPADEEEYRSRFIQYEQEKEDRKTQFLKHSLEGYKIGRRMYYHALKPIYFTTLGIDFVRGIYPTYTHETHKANMKKVVIAIRKIAEACYFLEKFDEGMLMCDEIINIIARHHMMNLKMLKLTLGVMGRIRIVQKKYKEAGAFINLGFLLDPESGILRKAKEYLEKCIKGEEFEDERARVRKRSNPNQVPSSFRTFQRTKHGPNFEEHDIEQILEGIRNLVSYHDKIDEERRKRFGEGYNRSLGVFGFYRLTSGKEYKSEEEFDTEMKKRKEEELKVRFNFFSVMQKLRPHLPLLYPFVDPREKKQSEEDLRNRVEYLQSDCNGFVSDPDNEEYLKMMKFTQQSLTFFPLRILLC